MPTSSNFQFLLAEFPGLARPAIKAEGYAMRDPESALMNLRVFALFRLADRIEARYTELRQRFDQLPQALLAKAFRGELVAQDPADEPAEVLLGRVRAEKCGESKERISGLPM